jgi:hypothetical protein
MREVKMKRTSVVFLILAFAFSQGIADDDFSGVFKVLKGFSKKQT